MANKNTQSADRIVYLEMFEAILSRRLLPGTKLTETNLAEIFNVSRTVIRRALLRLSHDSIVDIKANHGAMVSRPSIKQAREILRARQIIEASILRDVIACASKADIKDLRKLVEGEQQRFESDNRGAGIRISGDFHLKLSELSGNSTLTDILRRLIPQTSLIIAQYEKPGYACCSHVEHFELIDAIEKGDVDFAIQLLEVHLQGIEEKLLLEDEESNADLSVVFSHLN